MNQTFEQLGKEYVSRLKRKMKLYREFPELFENEDFRQRYVREGDRDATLAFLFERLQRALRRRPARRRTAPGA